MSSGCLQALPHLLHEFYLKEADARRRKKKERSTKEGKSLNWLLTLLFRFSLSAALFFSSSFPFIQIPIDANCEHPFMLIFSINFWFHTQWVSTLSLRSLFQLTEKTKEMKAALMRNLLPLPSRVQHENSVRVRCGLGYSIIHVNLRMRLWFCICILCRC